VEQLVDYSVMTGVDILMVNGCNDMIMYSYYWL